MIHAHEPWWISIIKVGVIINLVMGAFDRDYAFGADVKLTQYVSPAATFMGIVREDGRVATRNYIGILTSVNCSATVARMIARRGGGPKPTAYYRRCSRIPTGRWCVTGVSSNAAT